ncbi:hypothetical protein FisN_15Hh068 [Fistulifera solaris]|jgi:uncharacterized protein (DUF924 family)|uniref:Uncharacterized protein n=1 Tax=Fistulifera solaris TaxID=1519565 RepID=A0A1Z5K9U2_FISSO|nr:hypothetical protein FisN_15Hh068 [Fistulifera solaris]|eukprot:GAX23033.1 hypothetical protein FisN_15Hh068 [Fistulifera solaris]
MTQPLSFAEFVGQPFIQAAVQNPMTPESVLSFFFGVNFQDPESIETGLRQGHCLQAMNDLWWKGLPEYDQLCQSTFTEAIRAAGKGTFLPNESMQSAQPLTTSRIDDYMSEIILCDQLSRNCFRGSLEAFAYDPVALQRARQVADLFLSEDGNTDGEIYLPYTVFLNTAFMHSESLEDHQTILKVMEKAEAMSPPQFANMWKIQREMALDHSQVIERFGRYPHRNFVKGRTNTPEEDMWLKDVENLPMWAKSQMAAAAASEETK